MLNRLIRKFRKQKRFTTISDLDLLTHSKTQVPMLRVIKARLVIDYYLN